MSETRLRARTRRTPFGEREQAGLECETAERDDHPRAGNPAHLADQVIPAVGELPGKRPVVGRCALDGGGQQRAEELEPVSGADRLRAVGQPDRVNGAKEEVPRFVSGEDPSRAITAVRCGSQTDDEKTRSRIPERGQGPTPVRLAAKAARGVPGGFFAPRDQARASAAGDDAVRETPELAAGIG